jgi:hypothetical protein
LGEQTRHGEVLLMHAMVGDRILVRSNHVGGAERRCEVLEVRGADGAPPYRVRWGDDGHESLLFPGSDAVVRHSEDLDG